MMNITKGHFIRVTKSADGKSNQNIDTKAACTTTRKHEMVPQMNITLGRVTLA
jgi:hypothetical protein